MNPPSHHNSTRQAASPWPARLVAGLLLILAGLPQLAAGEDADALPVLEVQRLDGSHQALSDGRGVVTVVVIWSPESLASRKSLGELQRFTARHPPGEINVIVAATQGDAAELREFASARKLDLPLSRVGVTNLGPFPEATLPHVLVIDRDGGLQAAHRGLFRLQTLERMVAPLQRP
ncbi:MAG TPA: hypothetical protein VN639_21345 [Azonexus sp.]|nr:hypothetical protein [Azonexus sp.]